MCWSENISVDMQVSSVWLQDSGTLCLWNHHCYDLESTTRCHVATPGMSLQSQHKNCLRCSDYTYHRGKDIVALFAGPLATRIATANILHYEILRGST